VNGHASFDWDERNIGHIARHGVKPEEAEQALLNDPIDVAYEVIDGEERWTSATRASFASCWLSGRCDAERRLESSPLGRRLRARG
jgi:hypothetical protein